MYYYVSKKKNIVQEAKPCSIYTITVINIAIYYSTLNMAGWKSLYYILTSPRSKNLRRTLNGKRQSLTITIFHPKKVCLSSKCQRVLVQTIYLRDIKTSTLCQRTQINYNSRLLISRLVHQMNTTKSGYPVMWCLIHKVLKILKYVGVFTHYLVA